MLTLLWALVGVGSEMHQGEVYRILYVHVPNALTAFFFAGILGIMSILYLIQKSLPSHVAQTFRPTLAAKAAAELGLLFTILTLVTGSIWGRPTWGVWWTWDARLTTTFILGLLFTAYLFMDQLMSMQAIKESALAVLGIMIMIEVPIIYKSVTWFRTLHQPPSLFNGTEALMAAEFKWTLILSALSTLILAIHMGIMRYKNFVLQTKLEEQLDLMVVSQ